MRMTTLALGALLAPSLAFAGSMQLRHQGRLLDSTGEPISGTHAVTFDVIDGAGGVLFTESYGTLELASGYYAVDLGSSANLDTSVFLDHGATSLRISVDGESLGTSALGGYPATVAYQASIDARLSALSSTLAPTSCPTGMTMVNPPGSEQAFCIEPTRRSGTTYWPTADAACAAEGKHLCTLREWFQASSQLGSSGFCGHGSWEWVADLAEHSGGGLRYIVGNPADCRHHNWGWAGYNNNQSGPYAYRCCQGAATMGLR